MGTPRPLPPPTKMIEEVLPARLPRRFGIGTMLGLMTVFALLLGGLRMLGLPPIAMLFLVGWVLVITVAQAVLFQGQRPKLASAVAGMAFALGWAWIATAIDIYQGAPTDYAFAVVVSWSLFILPFAALFGCLTGLGVTGIFLIRNRIRIGRWHETRQVEVPLQAWEVWRVLRETERLFLRPFEYAEAHEVRRLVTDLDAAMTATMFIHPSLSWAQSWISTHEPYARYGESLTLAIVRRDDQQLLGAIRLRLSDNRCQAELNGWLGRAYWDQGYATEAAEVMLHVGFTQMQLEEISAQPMVRNPAAFRVLEKLGLQPAELLPQLLRINGVREDCRRFTIQAAAWKARHPEPGDSPFRTGDCREPIPPS